MILQAILTLRATWQLSTSMRCTTDNLERATQYATPKLAYYASYGITSQFTRNLVNLQYDQVTIELDRTEMSVPNNAVTALPSIWYSPGTFMATKSMICAV